MYLDEIVAAQKRGEAKGITSVCSAHPYVIRQTLMVFEHPLIEATCNQVNQLNPNLLNYEENGGNCTTSVGSYSPQDYRILLDHNEQLPDKQCLYGAF